MFQSHMPASFSNYFHRNSSVQPFQYKNHCQTGNSKGHRSFNESYRNRFIRFFMFPQLLWLCLCAVPLGIGAGSIDTALNNYVALRYNAMQMSFLHCFYGVGVTVSPYLMSLALSDNLNWRGGYRTVFYIQLIIALLSFFSLPLWKKGQSNATRRRQYLCIATISDDKA